MTWFRLKSKEEINELLEISEEAANERIRKYTPLVRGTDGLLWKIELPNLFTDSFHWGPKFTEKVDMNSLKLIGCIPTFHTCAYHGFFKPTIAEVLAQIPEFYVDAFDAFEVLFDDAITEIIDNGFYGHRTTTLLYKFQAGSDAKEVK